MPTIKKLSWNNVNSGDTGAGSQMMREAMRYKTGALDPLTAELEKYQKTDMGNAERSSEANTGALIEQIRAGKTPEKSGFYNAGKLSDASYEYEKYKTAQAFKQRAEARAIAAAGRSAAAHKARMSELSGNKARNAKYAEQLSAMMGGSETSGPSVQKDAKDMTLGELQQMGDPRTNIFSDDGVYDEGKSGAIGYDTSMDTQPDYLTQKYNPGEMADIAAGKLPSSIDPANFGSVDTTQGDFPKYSFDPVSEGGPRRDVQFPFNKESANTVNSLVAGGEDRADLMKKLTTREGGETSINLKQKSETQTPLMNVIDSLESGKNVSNEEASVALSDLAVNGEAKKSAKEYTKDITEYLKESDKEIGKQFKEDLFSPPKKGTTERKEYDANISEKKEKTRIAKIDSEEKQDNVMTKMLMAQSPKYAGKYYAEYQKRKAAREKARTNSASELNFIQKEKAKVEAQIYKAQKLSELGLKPDGSSNDGSSKKYSKTKNPDKFISQLMKSNNYIYDPMSMDSSTMDGDNEKILRDSLHKAIKTNATEAQISEALAAATSPGMLGGWGPQDEVQFDRRKFNLYLGQIALEGARKKEAEKNKK